MESRYKDLLKISSKIEIFEEQLDISSVIMCFGCKPKSRQLIFTMYLELNIVLEYFSITVNQYE